MAAFIIRYLLLFEIFLKNTNYLIKNKKKSLIRIKKP